MNIISTLAIALFMFAMLAIGSSDAFGQVPDQDVQPRDDVDPRIVVDGAVPRDDVDPRIVVDGEVPAPVDGTEPRIVVDGEDPDDGDAEHVDPAD